MSTVGENVAITANVSDLTVGYKMRYITEFSEKVFVFDKMRLKDLPADDVRVRQVTDMLEEYYVVTGEKPKEYLLTKLANYILAAELKNKDVDKVTNTEFPVLSEYQLLRREKSQVSMETDNMDFLDTKFNKGLDSLAKTTIKKAAY